MFPQANPDGRYYSMMVDAAWRKNRRVSAPNSAGCPGVDINRNFDFVWNFPTCFSPLTTPASADPCDYEVYHGPSAFSEPENLNIKWILDNFTNVRYFTDVHSHGETILYSWGDDEDQSIDPFINFQNPAYDGKRGIGGDAYKEYIPATDLSTAVALANTVQGAIQAVRGTAYTVRSGFALYPTSGASDDYTYSRHFADPSKSKVISFTIEWGTEFQPPYSEMQNIMSEVTCGLLAFCLKICELEDAMNWQLSGNSGTNPPTDFLGTTDNQPLVIKTNGSEVARVTAQGNVGIGTATPRAKLEIARGAIVNGIAIGTDVAGIDYPYEYETIGLSDSRMNLRLQSPNAIIFHTGSPPTDKLTITQPGNIGIGTANPRAKLEVVGGAIVNGIAIGTDVAGIDYPYEYETIGLSNSRMNLRLQSPNAIIFHTGNPPTDKLTITKDGNVGIGISQPTVKFAVVDTGPNMGTVMYVTTDH